MCVRETEKKKKGGRWRGGGGREGGREREKDLSQSPGTLFLLLKFVSGPVDGSRTSPFVSGLALLQAFSRSFWDSLRYLVW